MFFRAGNLTYGEPAQLLDVSKFFITSQQYLSLPEKGCTFPFLSPFLARAYGLVAISPRKHVCEQSSSGTMLANHPSTQTIAHIYLLFFGDCHTCHIFRKQTNTNTLLLTLTPPFFPSHNRHVGIAFLSLQHTTFTPHLQPSACRNNLQNTFLTKKRSKKKSTHLHSLPKPHITRHSHALLQPKQPQRKQPQQQFYGCRT